MRKKQDIMLGAKYIMGIGGEMGDEVFEKRVTQNIRELQVKSNENCGRKSSTADTDKLYGRYSTNAGRSQSLT